METKATTLALGLLATCLLCAVTAQGRQRASGYCENGGVSLTVPGIGQISQPVMASYKSCTVTVYVSGSVTLASIYSDNAGTSKANPFTADSAGAWFFYAENGRYDVRFSGGGITTPFTRGDYLLNDYSGTIACDASAQVVWLTAGDKIAACWAAMPTGGTTDARGLTGAQNIPSTLVLNKAGTLLLPDGPFTLPTGVGQHGIKITADNVRIRGNGSTVLQATRDWADGSFGAVVGWGRDGTQVSGLDVRVTVTGADPGVKALIGGIWLRYDFPTTRTSTNYRIENNRVWTRGSADNTVNTKTFGILAQGNNIIFAKGGVIAHNYADDSNGRTIYVYNVEAVSIHGNYVTNMGATLAASNLATGIRVIASRNVSVTGNTVEAVSSLGVQLHGITVEGNDPPNDTVSVTGNTIYFSGGAVSYTKGMWIQNARNVTVSGNTIIYGGTAASTTYGIMMDPTDLTDVIGVEISGNRIGGWTGYDIFIDTDLVTDVTITGNFLDRDVNGVEKYFRCDPDPSTYRIHYFNNIEQQAASQRLLGAPASLMGIRFPHSVSIGVQEPLATRALRIQQAFANPADTVSGASIIVDIAETSGPNAHSAIGVSGNVTIGATNTQNWTGLIVGVGSTLGSVAGAAGTLSNVSSFRSEVTHESGTWTNYYGLRLTAPTGAGTITNKWSIKGEAGSGIAEIADGLKTAGQVVSTLATGTAPLTVASTTPVANLAATPTTYNAAGTQQTNTHVVWGTCTLGTSCAITLAGSAVFTSNTSYDCWPRDATTPANAVTVTRTSGSALAFTGTGVDVVNYFCSGN